MHRLTDETINQRISTLLKDEPEDYADYSTEEIFALSLSVMSHRRMIRTNNFNALLKEYDFRENGDGHDSQLVEQLFRLYQDELETRKFNFQESEVTVEFSQRATESLLDLSREERISHPRIHSEIERVARMLEQRSRREMHSCSATRDDYRQDLLLYLLENAEQNFDPSKASYITYAITTVRFRAKILLSLEKHRNNREVFSTFDNNEDTGRFDEKFSADTHDGGSAELCPAMTTEEASSYASASRQYETALAMRQFFSGHSSLEKALLYLKNRVGSNVSTFPFNAESVVEAAIRKGDAYMRS